MMDNFLCNRFKYKRKPLTNVIFYYIYTRPVITAIGSVKANAEERFGPDPKTNLKISYKRFSFPINRIKTCKIFVDFEQSLSRSRPTALFAAEIANQLLGTL